MAIDFMSAGGAVLPDGGTSGQVLAKKSDESFDAEWVDAVAGSLPKGGYPGYILQKKSVSDFDAEWVSIGGNSPPRFGKIQIFRPEHLVVTLA